MRAGSIPILEVSKAVNLDWINNQAFCLSQNQSFEMRSKSVFEVFSIRHYIKRLCQNAADKILKTPYGFYDIYILV